MTQQAPCLSTLFLSTLFLSTILVGCTPYPEAVGPAAISPVTSGMPGVYHRVEKGQTLWRIAKVYGVELDTVVRVNRLADAGRIEEGQQLFIPGATTMLTVPVLSAPPAAGLAGEPETAPLSAAGEDCIWPARGRVLAFYGTRTAHGPNKGLDIQAAEGTEVRAARSGRVAFVDENLRGYGKTVILDHGDELSTVYTHLASITVAPGQRVRQGHVVGTVGSTGRAAVPFLHFEIRRRHKPENPFYYLP